MLSAASRGSPAWGETVSLREIVLPRRCCAGSQHFAAGELTALSFTGLCAYPTESKPQLMQFNVLNQGPCLRFQLIFKTSMRLICSTVH